MRFPTAFRVAKIALMMASLMGPVLLSSCDDPSGVVQEDGLYGFVTTSAGDRIPNAGIGIAYRLMNIYTGELTDDWRNDGCDFHIGFAVHGSMFESADVYIADHTGERFCTVAEELDQGWFRWRWYGSLEGGVPAPSGKYTMFVELDDWYEGEFPLFMNNCEDADGDFRVTVRADEAGRFFVPISALSVGKALMVPRPVEGAGLYEVMNDIEVLAVGEHQGEAYSGSVVVEIEDSGHVSAFITATPVGGQP